MATSGGGSASSCAEVLRTVFATCSASRAAFSRSTASTAACLTAWQALYSLSIASRWAFLELMLSCSNHTIILPNQQSSAS